MKDVNEVLQQKESELSRVRHELESLRVAAPLLSDELGPDEVTKKRSSAEKMFDGHPDSEATGTDALVSLTPVSRSSFWKALTGKK